MDKNPISRKCNATDEYNQHIRDAEDTRKARRHLKG
ncbi:hypothetical protein ACQ27_gp306 [Klebsiella phage K64-1]|nr:hypothetical protein ACQ27_gp306 [Klebsiella phage K64-1]